MLKLKKNLTSDLIFNVDKVLALEKPSYDASNLVNTWRESFFSL